MTTAKPPAEPALLRDTNFLTFWTGQSISQFGAQLAQLAFPVLAVSLLHASEFEVGALNASATAAFLVVGLPAGAWVDRWLKRRVMIAADLLRLCAMLTVPLLWWTGSLAVWHLYVIAGLVGVATVFFDVSYQSYVPILVRGGQVPDANSKLEATSQLARMAGPAAAGGLLGLISAPLLFFGTSLGYLASAGFLWRTRDAERPQPRHERRPLVIEIREGLGFVRRHLLIRRIVMCTAATNFFSTLVYTLFPVLVLRDLGLGAGGLGLILSIGSIGGLLGATATPWIARRIGEGLVIPLASLIGSAFLGFIPFSTALPEKWQATALLALAEFGFSFGVLAYNIMQVSMRQRVCPPRLLGRMNASIRFLVWGVMPVGGLLAGVLGESIGLLPTIWIGIAGGFLGAVPVLFSPLRTMKKLPDSYEPDAAGGRLR